MPTRRPRGGGGGSEVATTIKGQIQVLLSKCPTVQYLISLVEMGKNWEVYMEDGFLRAKGNRLYIPRGGD